MDSNKKEIIKQLVIEQTKDFNLDESWLNRVVHQVEFLLNRYPISKTKKHTILVPIIRTAEYENFDDAIENIYIDVTSLRDLFVEHTTVYPIFVGYEDDGTPIMETGKIISYQ